MRRVSLDMLFEPAAFRYACEICGMTITSLIFFFKYFICQRKQNKHIYHQYRISREL
jgi:hypothetical protein